MLFKKNKYKKYKKIVLVDTENVGISIPDVKNDTLLYIYFTNKNKVSKRKVLLELSSRDNMKIIELENKSKTKNAMDFCIVSELTNIVKDTENNDIQFFIISKDKGYDAAINYLNSKYKKTLIYRRENMNILAKKGVPVLEQITANLNNHPEIKSHFEKYCQLSKLKDVETKQGLYAVIEKENYLKAITLQSITIHANTYKLLFNPFCGNFTISGLKNTRQFATYKGALKRFKEIQKNSIAYPNSLFHQKAIDLNIHTYVLESLNTQIPLQQTLINHLGPDEGNQLFEQFIACY